MERGGRTRFLFQGFNRNDLLRNWMWGVREKEESTMVTKHLAWVTGSSCYYRDGKTTQGRLVWGNSKTCNSILDLIWKYLSNIQMEIVSRQLAIINKDSWPFYCVYYELGMAPITSQTLNQHKLHLHSQDWVNLSREKKDRWRRRLRNKPRITSI